MRPSTYYRPKSVEKALQLLNEPDTAVLAGGTKLLAADTTAVSVVDLQALDLTSLHFENGKLHVGAMVRLADWAAWLAANESEGSPARLLQKAIRQAGPNTYRNAATAGGSVAARLADSELLAALLVLEAEILLLSPAAEWLSLSDYLAAGKRPSGLITQLRLAWETGRGGSERVARTPADYPIVSITAWQPEGGDPRLGASGIDDRPIRLVISEALVAAGKPEQAASAAAVRSRHPGDFRGSAGYRAEMAAVLTRRVLLELSLSKSASASSDSVRARE